MKKWFLKLKRKFWILKEKILSWLRKAGIMEKEYWLITFQLRTKGDRIPFQLMLVIAASNRENLSNCISEIIPGLNQAYIMEEPYTQKRFLNLDALNKFEIDITDTIPINTLNIVEPDTLVTNKKVQTFYFDEFEIIDIIPVDRTLEVIARNIKWNNVKHVPVFITGAGLQGIRSSVESGFIEIYVPKNTIQ